jgi:hypothetical protein
MVSSAIDVIRLQVVIAHDRPTPVTPTHVVGLLPELNAIFAPGGVRFVFDPATDYDVVPDALLDRDWSLVEPGSLNNPESAPPPVSTEEHHARRRQEGLARLGALLVICARGSSLAFSPSDGRWQLGDRAGWYSSGRALYVMWDQFGMTARSLGHEIGHYLHLVHTFYLQPPDVSTAQGMVRDAVLSGQVPRAEGALVFDADRPFVGDTPPDPGTALLAAVNANGESCGPQGAVNLQVALGGAGVQTYTVAPDRSNLMSYFGCPQPARFSAEQHARIHAALHHGDRQHLLNDGRRTWIPPRPAVATGPDGLHMVAIGGDATAFHAAYGSDPARLTAAWRALGVRARGRGGRPPRPAPVTRTNGYVDAIDAAFVGTTLHLVARRAGDGALLHKRRAGAGWLPAALDWDEVGLSSAGSPTLVSAVPGRLDLFARGRDGGLRHATWSNGSWSGLTSPGSAPPSLTLTGIPAVAALAGGQAVASRASDGAVWVQLASWSGPSAPWITLGGLTTGSPAIVATGTQLHVLAIGIDGAMYWNAASLTAPAVAFSGWIGIGGRFLCERPSVALGGAGFEVAARGPDGAVWHRAWTPGGWPPTRGWTAIGDVVTAGSPMLTAMPAGPGAPSPSRIAVSRGVDGEVVAARLGGVPTAVPDAPRWTVDLGLFVPP